MLFVLRLLVFIALGLSFVKCTNNCPPNESWTACANPCNTCELRGRCLGRPICLQGCDCKIGFFRDRNGYCVPEHRCQKETRKCPRNSIYMSCGLGCEPTCENPYPDLCTDDCVSGCFCLPGYLKTEDGNCVYPQECAYQPSPKECRKDEQYYHECTPSCKNTCESYNNPGILCECDPPGCFCAEGLVKRSDGKCVTPQDCTKKTEKPPPKCPENAVYDPCGPACPPTCEDKYPAPCKERCVPACYCKQGYLKSKDEKCVRIEECDTKELIEKTPKKCPEYSAFNPCGSACPPTCENKYPEPCKENCVPDCYCKPGYLKNKFHQCVPAEECGQDPPKKPTPKCPENAIYDPCGPACPPTCEDRYPAPCKQECVPACYCKPGYLKSKDEKCVRNEECDAKKPTVKPPPPPPPKCPENEVFIPCGPSCPPTCENRHPPPCKEKCMSACFCKPGYLRNKVNKCVHLEQCVPKVPVTLPVTCPENEVFIPCGPVCPPTCQDKHPPPCKERCVSACYCKPGYLKNKYNKCVHLEDCDTKAMCLPDEQYYDYMPNCKNTCENYNNPAAQCPSGPPGCFCRTGLVKRKDGRCVNPQECPARCRPDEQYYNFTPSCKNTCKNYNNPGVQCPPGPPGCFCKEGLVKRMDGMCVNPRDCPVTCRPDEQYYDYMPNCKNTCENYNNPLVPCPPGPPGCFCRTGLVKRKDGRCVTPQECPARCGANEQFYPSVPSCKNTCENFNNPAAICQPGPPGCFCRDGLVKRQDGRCVLPGRCPTRCHPQEQYYVNVPNCKNTCENFTNPGVICPLGPPGCFCRRGLVKRKDGRCILPIRCPNVCLPDEQYYTYMPNCRNTCENYNSPGVNCPPGPPGCFCRSGLVKRKDGRCVNPRECLPTCPPDEQYYEMMPSCKNTCENYNNPGINCPPGPPGCFCRTGLVKRKDGRCVNPRECRPTCPPDEQYYEKMPNCKNTCENYNNPGVDCPAGPPGCFCRTGLVKRKDGRCVNPQECPSKCRLDEQFYSYTPSCKNTCENYNNPGVLCPPGPPGCFCREGLVKRRDGRCVDPKECPAKCPQPDEKYYDYRPNCKNTCENFNDPGARCPPGTPGCFCREGLVKRKDGRCVDPRDCPAKCNPDEQYYNYVPNCKNTCENYNNPGVLCYPGPPGCFCKEGLVKRKDGKCVNPRECPVKCPPDEQYYEKMPNCKNTCENYNNPGIDCPAGPPGCFCRTGLVKRKDGRCVNPQECPAKCPPDEQFYAMMPNCKNTCENYNNSGIDCPAGPPGCFCRTGLVKRKDGRCVTPEACPVVKPIVCPEYAVFNSCATACPATCKDPNPGPCQRPCVPRCFCVSGYLQTDDGKCVRLDQCKQRNTPKCPENSVFMQCPTACPATCQEPYPGPCTKPCVPHCVCNRGFIQDDNGRCVSPNECRTRSPPKCPENAVFMQCPTACPATCQEPYPGPCIKPCIPRCVCNRGFLQDDAGRCVSPNECRPRTETSSEFCEGAYKDATSCDVHCKKLGNFSGVCIASGKNGCRCVPS